MHPIGIHLSYWQENWTDNLLPLIGKAHAAGFDVAEFPLLLPELDTVSIRGELARLGMRASCCTGLGGTTDISSPDHSIRKAGLQRLQTCLQWAAELGSPVLAGVTYTGWGVFSGDDRLQRYDQMISSLKTAAQIAADVNVQLCLEVVNRYEGFLLNTVQQGLQIVSEVGSPYIRLHLDTFHMNIEEDLIGAAIRQCGVQLGHLHCVENNRKVPGEGHIPWSEVVAAVDAIGYHGFIVAETFVNPAGEVGQGLSIHRRLTDDDLDTAAAKAASFLRSAFNHA